MHYGPETYGERIADIYDDLYEELFDKAGAVSFLAERAGGGPALELGIGTGRLAIPLKETGIDVHGIDASDKMIARLRAKPGGADIPITVADFTDIPGDATYPLIYVPFNTLFALPDQEDQLRCLASVTRHLGDGGVFVVEVFVPDVTRYERHQGVNVNRVEVDDAMMDVSRHDPVTQTVRTQHIIFGEKGVQMFPTFIRYAYPPELDVMARLAGLVLRERYENWRESPFTASSNAHISVYGKG